MSGRWIKKKRDRSAWGRELARKRWQGEEERRRQEVDSDEISGNIVTWPRDQPFYRIEVEHLPTGRIHRFELFASPTGYRNQYRITQNGREWKTAMGLTRFMRGLRAAMFGLNAEYLASKK